MFFRRIKAALIVSLGVIVSSLALVAPVGASPFSPTKSQSLSTFVPQLVTKVQLLPRGIKRKLREAGFNNITIIDQRPPGFTVKACRNGKRFLLRVHRRGRIVERQETGRCKDGLTPPQVRRELRARGFEEIRFLDRELPTYVASACKDGVRYRLRMNRWGAINKKTRVGRCGRNDGRRDGRNDGGRAVPHDIDDKSPVQVRRILEDRGFVRIVFTDRRLPTYVVRACKDKRRMELRIDASGWIRKRDQIGRCETAREGMKPREVRKILRTRGFNRIVFTDKNLPVYVAEACRHDQKFELQINRFARIKKRRIIGECRGRAKATGYSAAQVRDILQRRGYREIDFFDRSLPGYGVTACKRGQKFRMKINQFAEIKNRNRTGFCRPPVSAPPPVDDNVYDDVDDEDISGTERIDPETCQNYLDALVRRNRIHFDVASASLRRNSHGLLRRLARVMDRCPSSRIEISGHTDSDGSRDYNRDLSRKRAKSVVRYLNEEGVSLRRMTAFGYGEDQPLMAYERTERDKARNRRIEFTVLWGDDQ